MIITPIAKIELKQTYHLSVCYLTSIETHCPTTRLLFMCEVNIHKTFHKNIISCCHNTKY